jgi:hypothetical protein
MPKPDDWFERGIYAFVSRVSGRTVAVTSLVLYFGVGLALPLALDWPKSWLISANFTGVFFGALISLTWFVMQIEAKDRRHLLEWTTDLRHLTAEEFEWFVGEVFRREGWAVRETGSQDRADGNIDLENKKGNDRRIVQCKRWTSKPVGIDEIRAFAGTLLRENLLGNHGVFVTFSRFNVHAEAEAKRTGIDLVDRSDLYRRSERVRRAEPCPICGRPMLLDRSPHGWWFRCVAAGCSGKRDLDREPARAVELLTQTSFAGSTPRTSQ